MKTVNYPNLSISSSTKCHEHHNQVQRLSLQFACVSSVKKGTDNYWAFMAITEAGRDKYLDFECTQETRTSCAMQVLCKNEEIVAYLLSAFLKPSHSCLHSISHGFDQKNGKHENPDRVSFIHEMPCILLCFWRHLSNAFQVKRRSEVPQSFFPSLNRSVLKYLWRRVKQRLNVWVHVH